MNTLGLASTGIFFLLAALTPLKALAQDFSELQEVSVDYRNFHVLGDNQRDLLVYPEPPKEKLFLNLNMDLLWGHMYANSQIQATTVDSQYRGIGLEQRLGFYLGKSAEVGYIHHSQHVMDRAMGSIPVFPVTDAVQVMLYLYRK